MGSAENNANCDFALLANLLRQIINVIETSSGIAEERGMDVASKFWIAFEKISGKQDIDMIERQSRNIEILILFASLFSIINATFIIAMQPDPADTTNDLLVQLIMMQNTWNGSLVAVSAPVGYSSSKIWMQVLAYMSLIFSLLAAFGAVVGKQFLDYYETNTNSDRLEGRYQRRHRMFLELQKMRFEPIMQSFTTLVEISIFLFILSLAAAMWMQHRIISLLILVPIAYGSLLYMYFVCVSLRSPDAPFQTPISLLIRYFLYHDKDKDHQSYYDSTASAISWILKVSTNPDIFRLALDLMVTIPNLRKQSQLVLSPSFIKKLLGQFKASFDSTTSDTGHTVLLGRGLIYISWKIDGATENLNRLTQKWKHWSSWRRLYFPQALEHCNTSFCQMKETDSADEWEQLKQADNTRTALRMALGAGMDKFVNPDKHDEYVELVWHGQFGSELYLPDVDWLMDCARHFHDAKDFNAAGDALLLLSDLKNISQDSIVPFLNSSPRSHTLLHPALRTACRAVDINSPCDSSLAQAILTAISSPIRRGHYGGDLFANAIQLLELTDWSQDHPLVGAPLIDIQRLIFLVLSAPSLDKPVEFGRYCHALIHFMRQATSLDCKRAAVHIAYRIRQDLARITDAPSLSVSAPLQTDVLSTLSPALLAMVPSEFDSLDHFFYLRLIFTLTSHPNWLPRLEEDGHINRCFDIMPDFSDKPPSSFFYLAGIFLRIEAASGKKSAIEEKSAAGEQSTPGEMSVPGQQSTLVITPSQWWDLTMMAWHVAGHSDGPDSDVLDDSDGVEILEALIAHTKSYMPQNASPSDLEFLCNGLDAAILKMELRQPPPSKEIIDAMKDMSRLRLSAL